MREVQLESKEKAVQAAELCFPRALQLQSRCWLRGTHLPNWFPKPTNPLQARLHPFPFETESIRHFFQTDLSHSKKKLLQALEIQVAKQRRKAQLI